MAWKPISSETKFSCLSTDTKPTNGISEGAVCAEVQVGGADAGKVYFYKFLQGDWRRL